MPDLGPGFDRPVPPDGYAWWYIDALNNDETRGLTIIAFIGSVFSPYYARARRRGSADPYNFCALNVALYEPHKNFWAMTERRRDAVDMSRDRYRIGPSALDWNGQALSVTIDETTVPIPSPLRGSVEIRPQFLQKNVFALGSTGRHNWHPIAPNAGVAVTFERPDVTWQGTGYFDMNFGDAPLENDFRQWNWSRTSHGSTTSVYYNISSLDGQDQTIAARFNADGSTEVLTVPPVRRLPGTFWRMQRETRAPGQVTVKKTLEDSPFYTRSLLSADIDGEARPAIHESLSLERFRNPLVQLMLPFRMPRAVWPTGLRR